MDGSSIFKWKSVQNDIKFCLGTISLAEIKTEEGIMEILKNASKELVTWKNKAAKAEAENETTKHRYLEVVSSLETCTKLKQEQEAELLTKFVLLINEKKAKIRKLLKQNEIYADKIKQLQEHAQAAPGPEIQPSTSKDNFVGGHKPSKEISSSSETEDSFPVIFKRKTLNPVPPKVMPVSPVKLVDPPIDMVTTTGLSDFAVTTSSDSTVDINEMIDDM